jgi:hypothetical protein
MSSLKAEALRANRPGRFTVLEPQARWIYPRAFIPTHALTTTAIFAWYYLKQIMIQMCYNNDTKL